MSTTRPGPGDSDSLLERDGLDVGRRAVAAGRHAVLAQVAGLVANLGTMAILGRLLARQDFGLTAMAGTVTGLLYMLTDGGLSLATIRSGSLSRQQASNLFWINAAFGICLAACFCGLAPLIAWFYSREELIPVCAAMSLAFVAAGAGVQHDAVLRRNLMVKRASAATLLGSVVGSLVAIGMAIAGFGYWSLVGQAVASAAARTCALWCLCPWMPGPPRRGAGTMHMLRFGGASTGAGILGYAIRNADNALIGWFWGAEALGIYSRAYALITQPLLQVAGPINAVAIPALAAANTSETRLSSAYLRTFALSCAITIPAASALLVLSEPLVLTLLGPSWSACIPVARALGGVLVVGTAVSGPIGWAFTATGRVKAQFRWTLIATPLYVASYAIALPTGIVGVALAASGAIVVLALPALLLAIRGTSLRPSDMLREAAFPTLATVAAAGAAFAILSLTEALSAPARLLFGGLAFVAAYLGAWALLPVRRRQLLASLSHFVPPALRTPPR